MHIFRVEYANDRCTVNPAVNRGFYIGNCPDGMKSYMCEVRHPEPIADKQLSSVWSNTPYQVDYAFAFSSLAQLRDWFNNADDFTGQPYRIGVYIIDDYEVMLGDKQVIFRADAAQLVGKIKADFKLRGEQFELDF